MNRNDDERPELSADERAFVERLGSGYAPAPASASRRVAFRAALEQKLDRRRRTRLFAPVLVAAAAAAALALWLDLPGTGVLAPTNPSESRPMAQSEESVEDTLLALTATTDPIDRNDSLPADYEAIASLLLDDV